MNTILDQGHRVDTEAASITELLREGAVIVALEAADKPAVINALVDAVSEHPHVLDIEEVRRAVFERESVMSTGVGAQLALPHARTKAVTGVVAAFATLAPTVDFDAIDDQPVDTVFLLLGPPVSDVKFIRLLSRISRLMNWNDVRTLLRGVVDASQVATVFEDAEGELLDR